MKSVESRVTSQGQVSVPAEVRRRLGITTGTVLEWVVEGDSVVVRRARKYSHEDVRRALWADGPPPEVSLDDLKAGIGAHMKRRYAIR